MFRPKGSSCEFSTRDEGDAPDLVESSDENSSLPIRIGNDRHESKDFLSTSTAVII